VVVYLVVDQLPMSLFEPLLPHFEGGFARLTGPDAFVAQARYAHAVTYTGPGHATLSTGTSPSVHGIVSNGWMESGEKVYCCDVIEKLRAEPLADRVSAAGGKVAAISLKDRGALLLGGRTPDAVVYFDKKATQFTGPEWAQVDIQGVLAEDWTSRLPEPLLALYPDAQAHEPADAWGTAAFPHPALGAEQAAYLPYHPQAGALVTDIAIRAIDALALGADDQPDLLTVSYSQTDYVGHMFSPQSREALDAMLVLDEDLERLFAHLDAEVGSGQWSAVLSADHGAAPGTAKRVDYEQFRRVAQEAYTDAGYSGDLAYIDPTFYLPTELAVADRQPASAVVAEALRGVDGLAGAWAWREEGFPEGLPYRDTYLASVDAHRSGDVFVMLAENALFATPSSQTGSSHGTPYDYDAVVPFLAVGSHIRSGRPTDEVDVRQIPATVGALLGVGAPAEGIQDPVDAALRSP